jgi:hypothetical protein
LRDVSRCDDLCHEYGVSDAKRQEYKVARTERLRINEALLEDGPKKERDSDGGVR